jgi:hypothetical protein
MREDINRPITRGLAVSLISLAIAPVALVATGAPSEAAQAPASNATEAAPATGATRLSGETRRLRTRFERIRHREAAARRSSTAATSRRADWYAIARCESGGRWHINNGNGYWGGLQFAHTTWFANGGGRWSGKGWFPFSPTQQIAVGKRVLARQGPRAWPNCFRWA